MKILEYIDRINTIHRLIQERKTGNPKKFAKKLLICPSRLYAVLEEFKLMGAPIKYSRRLQSYYYIQPFEVSVEAKFRLLNPEELRQIEGGNYFQKNCSLFFL